MSKKQNLSHHQRVANNFGYRNGTKVGTAGYFNTQGGFTHVYFNPKTKTEIHVLTKQGVPQSFAHIGEDGSVHRVGDDHKELRNHLGFFHPEILEQKRKEREKKVNDKKREAQRKREKNRVMKVKVVKEHYQRPFNQVLKEEN